jgi:hypothetical protein
VLAAVTTLLVGAQLTLVEYCVLLLRDIMTAIGFLVARLVVWLRPVTFRARPLGKVVTVLQLLTLAVVVIAPAWATVLLVAIGVASLLSIADYTLALWRARPRRRAGG